MTCTERSGARAARGATAQRDAGHAGQPVAFVGVSGEAAIAIETAAKALGIGS